MKTIYFFLLLLFSVQSCKSQVFYFEAESKEKNKDGTPIDYITLEYHKDTNRVIFRISHHAEEYGETSDYIYLDSSLNNRFIHIYHRNKSSFYMDGLYQLPIGGFQKLYYPRMRREGEEEKEYIYRKELKEMDNNQQELYIEVDTINKTKF